MLKIKNLETKIHNKIILKNLDLEILENEKHCILSPNGQGKSTLLKSILGFKDYNISYDIFEYKNFKDINTLDLNERVLNGIYLAHQTPIEIEGLNNAVFLKTITNNSRKFKGLNEYNQIEFFKLLKEKLNKLELDISFIERGVNSGFSGGEKKKNEVLQMLLLDPDLILLDEIDSGVDIDSINIISKNINELLENSNKSILMVTHYEKIIKNIKPQYVHILLNGKIVETGDYSLSEYVFKNGYSSFYKKGEYNE